MGEKLPPSFPFPCKSQKLETHNKKHFEGFHKKRKQPGESLARIYLSKQDKVGGNRKEKEETSCPTCRGWQQSFWPLRRWGFPGKRGQHMLKANM
jgi:hypothetical protein